MASRNVHITPGRGARSLLTWGIDLWPYVNGKALINKINLKETVASDMLDILHYFFEEDLFYSSAEQAEGRDRAREAIYNDFYGEHYKYSSAKSSSANGQGISRNFDFDVEVEEEITPFDPLQKKKPTKPYVSPTKVNAALTQPFGTLLDGPLTK